MKKAEYVTQHRKRYFDQVVVLLEKGGRTLYRVLALRHGVNASEYMRRAALSYSGLNALPYPDDLTALEAVKTREEAEAAVYRLQAAEIHNAALGKVIAQAAPEADRKTFELTIPQEDLTQLRAALDRQPAPEPGTALKICLTGREMRMLRRILANAQDAGK